MTKRIENYSKNYRSHTDNDPESRGELYLNRQDTIISALHKICIDIATEDNIPRDISQAEFLLYNQQALIRINITGTKELTRDSYTRYVSLEIMPSETETPKELSDLLKQRGFTEIYVVSAIKEI